MHGVAPLIIDRKLCKFAEEWARNLASRGVMQHRSTDSYGENLYCKYGSGTQVDASAEEAIKSWYDEIKLYNFNKPGFSSGTGHFTQVVWRGSQRLGIAKAQNNKGQVFIVANYDPPGNYQGQFPDNVPSVGAPKPLLAKVSIPRPIEQSTTDFSTFEVECLTAHNNYRSLHGAPKLTLNRNLCQFAGEWAQKLLAAGAMKHRSNNEFGENLFAKWGSGSSFKTDGAEAVKAWYDEIQLYNFNKPGFSSGTGHFTQVVWMGSRELGVAVAQKNGAIFVVANYDPPGNFMGQFPANVKPRSR